jgi:hypothetical protein
VAGIKAMTLLTRRKLMHAVASIGCVNRLSADGPKPLVTGIDHIKIRVANSGASAIFYYHLFGGEIIAVRNSTFPGTPEVDEFFLKVGAPQFPYIVFAQVRAEDLLGLDHISLLADNPAAIRSRLNRHGVALVRPDQGLWFRDADGRLVELMLRPTFGIQAPGIRVKLPMNFGGVRPAFEATAVAGFGLRSVDVARSIGFFHETFDLASVKALTVGAQAVGCGRTIVEVRPTSGTETSGLDRIAIVIRGVTLKQARRTLQERGIHPHGSSHEILFRDPDGNEVGLIAS